MICDSTGNIPSELGLLLNLNRLLLQSNRLTGPLWACLESIFCFDGDLTKQFGPTKHRCVSGTIPSELGELSALVLLQLQRNQLTGQLNYHSQAIFFGGVSAFWLPHRVGIGCLPTQLGQLHMLYAFDLYMNNLTGKNTHRLLPCM